MRLIDNMNSESIRKLNLRDPVLVKPSETIRKVIRRLRDAQLGCAILVDEQQKPVGMFTECMVTQLVATHPESIDDPVEQHAAKRWPQVNLDDNIISVLDALDLKNTRFLSVVDEDGKVAGVTGQKGLMEYIADHFPNQVMVQRIGLKPTMTTREGA